MDFNYLTSERAMNLGFETKKYTLIAYNLIINFRDEMKKKKNSQSFSLRLDFAKKKSKRYPQHILLNRVERGKKSKQNAQIDVSLNPHNSHMLFQRPIRKYDYITPTRQVTSLNDLEKKLQTEKPFEFNNEREKRHESMKICKLTS